MGKEPTYKELKEKDREQEKLISDLIQKMEILQESEEKAKTIFENANDLIVYVDVDGTCLDINDRVEDILGYKPEEVIGRNFTEFELFEQEVMEKNVRLFEKIILGKPAPMLEFDAFRKDKSRIFIEVNARLVKKSGKVKGILNIIRDVTERKLAAEEVQKYQDHLEELVKERTINLEEANTALKVLLKKREEDKIEIEEKMLFNVKDLILPYLEVLRGGKLNTSQKAYLDIIKSNLNDIVSPFVRGLCSGHLKFTPMEIKVANFVKHGKTTKEIALMLNLSIKTIEFHRENIRKKLGIKNKRMNLRTSLISIQ